MDSDLDKTCYQKALQLLARRDHSSTELKMKLHSRGYGPSAIEPVIRECRRLNYLNDARFAEGYLKQLQRKGYGIHGIRRKLRSKGLSESIIQQRVESHGSDAAQLEQCRRVLEKKMRPYAEKTAIEDQGPKLHRFLYGRGFPGHIIRQAIAEAIAQKNAAAE